MRYFRKFPGVFLFFFLSGALIVSAASEKVTVIEEKFEDGVVRLIAQLHDCLDVTISVSLTLTNMDSTQPEHFTIDSDGQTAFELVTLQHSDRKKAWRYKYNWHWKLGGRGNIERCHYGYSLPYKGSYKVSQGEYGSFSHYRGSEDEHAIDWSMPEGTEILAARAGVVSAVRRGFRHGGEDEKFKKKANYVVIRHDDNTFAEYYHLKHGGVMVNVGDYVQKGQLIGLSGNTGFSSAPHLHFAVFQTIDGYMRRTVPVKFITRNGTHETLVQGRTY